MLDAIDPADAPRLRFLARWSLATGLMAVGLLFTFLLGVGFDPSLPPDFAELIQASRQLAWYRIAMTFDSLSWLMIGGMLLIFAALARDRDSRKAVFLSACAIGQLAGALGGFMRLNGTSALAARYAVGSPAEQATLQQAYLVLDQVIGSQFHAGQLLQGVGFLLAASITLGIAGWPRWLSYWVGIQGLAALLVFVARLLLGYDFFPLIVLYVVVGVVALPFAIAGTFWRIPKEASVIGAPEATAP